MASANLQAGNELCSDCAALNISAHKFNRLVDDLSLHGDYSFDDKGLEAMNIGFLDEFYGRRNRCPFCRLVYEATHRDDGQGVGHDGLDRDGRRVSCWVDWQLDGRFSTSQDPGHHPLSGALTRRLRLYSKTKDFQACYLVPLRQEHDIKTPSFQARPVQTEQANIHQLRSWLDLCEAHHGQCSTQNSQLESSMKLRVIDVSLMCIVEIPSTQRYCTLSYCWGRTKPFCLKEENYAALRRNYSIGADILPRTILDAIRLISALGERYIWIDAMCIFQDSVEDWQKIAPLMDKIYGSSIITICAASGDSCVFGLPGSQQSSRLLSQSVENCAGLKLLAIKPLEDRIEHSPWNRRAWTFQERMLSRRCLIFVDDRVFFQCRQVTWSEELDCESSASFWTLDAIHSPLNLFNENPLRRYSKSVELYSGRLLTVQQDRLVAFEGIALSLAPKLHPSNLSTPFQYGLPAWYFDWALLWELKTPGERINQNKACGVYFPSWSWCGWHGTSEWRMSTTSTVLLNLHEWLMLHTWITWYLGADPEHELVFRVGKFKETQTRGRWAGYAPNEPSTITNFADDQDAYGRPLDVQVSLATKPTHRPLKGHLHFFTWSAFFKISRKSMSGDSFKSNLQSGLHRFSIVDCRSDWCGTIILNESYFNCVGAVIEFIAISEARDFALEEYDSWTYYVPGEREEAEWYLYYALMIRWNEEKSVAERLGLAKIYKTAFQSGSFDPGFRWKEITLG